MNYDCMIVSSYYHINEGLLLCRCVLVRERPIDRHPPPAINPNVVSYLSRPTQTCLILYESMEKYYELTKLCLAKKKIGKSLTCAYFHPFGLGGYSNSPLQPNANSKQFLYAWRLEMFKFIVRIIE